MTTTYRLLPDHAIASYEDYLAASGPSAVVAARKQSSDQIIALLEKAGLRGRGGAGFPTARKWRSVASHACKTRFAVCNAAEGEPGTFKDRYLIRMNPYAVIEGLLIAAHVVAADRAYIAIKESFELEIKRLEQARTEMVSAGLFADDFVTVVTGPDHYLFGEEKALLNVIDGGGPLPRPPEQPPYEWGLRANITSPNPAVVNNVETYAHVASIVRLGAEAFRQRGTDDTPGTVLFTLSGDIQRPGVYEWDAGAPVSQVLAEAGGGPPPGSRFKALLSGVASGVLPATAFDTKTDFGSMSAAGSGLGSAGFIVLADQTSIFQVARAVARFLYVESCDQCTACKEGLRSASEGLDLIAHGEIEYEILEQIIDGAHRAPQLNRCYLPVQGSFLIPSLIETFPDEFRQAISAAHSITQEWILPKISDYDAKKRQFRYDTRQVYKQPDWTYQMPDEMTAAPKD